MTSLDCLLLDAKQAILIEHHRRFQALQQAGKWEEAMRQFQTTMACASDLLSDSLTLLERVVEDRRRQSQERPPSDPEN